MAGVQIDFLAKLLNMPGALRIYFVKCLSLQRAAFVLIASLGTICMLLAGPAYAQTDANEIKIPAAIYSGIDHLLALADPAKDIAFDPQMVAGVLDFVETPKRDDALYYANRLSGLTSGYYEFDIARSLGAVVAYAYNPDIPGIATMPASARLSQWTGAKANSHQLDRLMHCADNLDSPVVLKGIQSLEITPDPTSGAYYAYKSSQHLIMFKHRRRRVLVTVTRQAHDSTVGKKGYLLGEDSDWDYYYSGHTGLTLPALGWVRSYIYDSAGINIYYEIDPGSPTVRCALFKWLRAGWSKINMVQKKDIHQGLKRFAMPLKESDEDSLLNFIAKISPRGNTNIGDGIKFSTEALFRSNNRNQKHIIVISDGLASAVSESSLDQLASIEGRDLTEESALLETKKAASRGIQVSAIHIAAKGEGSSDFIKTIARAGNGKVYRISDSNTLTTLLC